MFDLRLSRVRSPLHDYQDLDFCAAVQLSIHVDATTEDRTGWPTCRLNV